MFIRIQDDSFQDKHLVEATYIRWCHDIKEYVVMEVFITASEKKTAGSTSLTTTRIEDEPSLRLRLVHGDRVYCMNDQGLTMDSKRIVIKKDEL